MVRLVKWINKFNGIYTIHCCEGGEIDKPEGWPEDCGWNNEEKPYVVFVAMTQRNFANLVDELRDILPDVGWYTFDVNRVDGQLRFSLKIASQDQLDRINDRLKKLG